MKNKNPQLLILEVTNKCNLNCTHCYLGNKFGKKYISINLIQKLIKETKQIKPLIIALSGGEPLLHPNIIKIIKLLCNAYSKVILETNSLLLDNKILGFLKEYNTKVIVQISIDGTQRIHDKIRGKGTFKKILFALKKLKKLKIHTNILFTLSKENISTLKVVYKQLKEYCDVFGVERFIPMGNGRLLNQITPNEFKTVLMDLNKTKIICNDPLSILIKMKKNSIGCSAGIFACCISPEGLLYPCPKLRINAGNLKKRLFMDVWQNSSIFLKLRQRKEYVGGKCKNCEFLENCGGCRASPYAIFKDWTAEDPLCWK